METELLHNKNSIMLNDVLHGLTQKPKTLPCKYFYDEKGSKLFNQICDLEEYYLVRTELEIIKDNILEITKALGKNCMIIELGCGSHTRIHLLFDQMLPAAYVPIDISENTLAKFTKSLQDDYPNLRIAPLCTDYTKESVIPIPNVKHSKKVVYYPGSNIGNLNKVETFKILKIIHKICGKDNGLLIGFDLKKDKAILESAYNDKEGVTAAFNLNILSHINNALGANFDINNFEHKAIYNEQAGQIEMYLISKCKQEVRINNKIIFFKENESILTEISKKYDIDEFKELVNDFFEVQKVWTDKQQRFCAQYLKAK